MKLICKTCQLSISKLLKVACFAIFLVITTEVASWFIFQKILPSHLRDSAQVTVYGVLPSAHSIRIPTIKAYLWSNYMPNPLSKEVNKFGWRYGGGPKKEHFRILCLGGSTTWSSRVTSPEKSYPAQMERYLNNKGYKVDVVNGGCPYYTSAELIGTLAFRGIYTQPDLVLIHTGGNDIAPFCSPREYKPDYSHWRTVDEGFDALSRNDVYRALWGFPSWSLRLFTTLKLKPDGFIRTMIGKQLNNPQEGLLATNDITDREPTGLEKNLRSLIGLINVT